MIEREPNPIRRGIAAVAIVAGMVSVSSCAEVEGMFEPQDTTTSTIPSLEDILHPERKVANAAYAAKAAKPSQDAQRDLECGRAEGIVAKLYANQQALDNLTTEQMLACLNYPFGDDDGDGVMNLFDIAHGFNDNFDFDGDGIPLKYDKYPHMDDKADNDGNGYPDWIQPGPNMLPDETALDNPVAQEEYYNNWKDIFTEVITSEEYNSNPFSSDNSDAAVEHRRQQQRMNDAAADARRQQQRMDNAAHQRRLDDQRYYDQQRRDYDYYNDY